MGHQSGIAAAVWCPQSRSLRRVGKTTASFDRRELAGWRPLWNAECLLSRGDMKRSFLLGEMMNQRNVEGIAGWLLVIVAFQVLYLLQHLRQLLEFLGRKPMWTPFAVGELAGHIVLP